MGATSWGADTWAVLAVWLRRTVRTWSQTDRYQHSCTVTTARNISFNLSVPNTACYTPNIWIASASQWMPTVLTDVKERPEVTRGGKSWVKRLNTATLTNPSVASVSCGIQYILRQTGSIASGLNCPLHPQIRNCSCISTFNITKTHLDRSLLTEPSVYTSPSWGWLFSGMGKFDLLTQAVQGPFSWTKSLIWFVYLIASTEVTENAALICLSFCGRWLHRQQQRLCVAMIGETKSWAPRVWFKTNGGGEGVGGGVCVLGGGGGAGAWWWGAGGRGRVQRDS